MKSNLWKSGVFSVLAATGLSMVLAANARASDDEAQEFLDQANGLYSQRGTRLSQVPKALPLLATAVLKAEDSDLKFDALILSSRCYYWIGLHQSKKSDRLESFENGYKKALAAIEENEEYAEGPYLYAISLARWAKTKGILESLGRKKELMDKLNETIDLETRDGEEGRTINGYGPDRVFGKMYFELPFFAGGSHDKAIKHLKAAYENTPADKQLAINIQYYAAALLDGNNDEERQGCRLLKDNVNKKPEEFDADKIPESREELEEIKVLYNENCQ